MPARRVLVLSGTREGRELTDALLARGYDVITSLAGVTQEPILPQGPVRSGGFGGIAGLAAFLEAERISLVADATHPFATQISNNAHAAAATTGTAYMRLERPPWVPGPTDRWSFVGSAEEAAAKLPRGATVLATIGRKEIGVFFARNDLAGIARMIEAPPTRVPPQWTIELSRPPFTVEAERQLMQRGGITHLVAKNSGGCDGFAKLIAARELGVNVVLIKRPNKLDAPSFSHVDQLILSLEESLLP